MRTITLHGASIESNIDSFEKYANDTKSEWQQEDIEAVKRWNVAYAEIFALEQKDLCFLNENHVHGKEQLQDDLRYYLADVGLWTGAPPYTHPTVKRDVERRKIFKQELLAIKEEQRKRDEEYALLQQRAIKENDYRNVVHPRFHQLNNEQLNARKVIGDNAFIEDFGTEDRVGGINLYKGGGFNPPLWLQEAYDIIYNYYLNCGGNYPHPEADFATVMYGVVSGVNGSNAYLMQKNYAGNPYPVHWTEENDFGRARIVSEGRTLRHGGQCDEVIEDRYDRMKVIWQRRKLIQRYRDGHIKKIDVWPSVENPSPQDNDSTETIRDDRGVEQDLTDHKAIQENPNKELIEKIVGYAKEVHQGRLHVERWKRVLEALDPTYDYPYPPMTAVEAQEYANRGWKRWVPVTLALGELESKKLNTDA